MFGDEPYAPYDLVILSSYLAGDTDQLWLQDSLLVDSMIWNAPADDEIFVRFQSLEFEGRSSFTFQVLENRRSEQLWRAQEVETVYDPLRLDSVPATHLFQVSLYPQ